VRFLKNSCGLYFDNAYCHWPGYGFVCRLCRERNVPAAFLPAVFGLFQGLMPFVGYVLGISFASWMQLFDHWFAFFILSVIGIKMIYESFISKPHEVCVGCDCQEDIVVDWRKVVVLAFATSIDAMATGLVFVSYPGTISTATITIGLVTLFFAFSGMFIGVRFGRRLRLNIEMLGGIILIAIGMKILFQHLLHGA
jgi:putative Mn2+ efflux pump MntP